MNERFRALALQAGLEMCGCGCDMPTKQSAKFAELIVKECISVIVAEQDIADQNWVCKDGVHIAWTLIDHCGDKIV